MIHGRCVLSSYRKHRIREYRTVTPGGNPGPWEPLVMAFSSTHQHRILFFVLLLKGTLLNVFISYDSLTLNSQPTELYVTHACRNLP